MLFPFLSTPFTELHENRLTPDDIHWVVSTHGHSDHLGNNNLFPKAKHIVGTNISQRNRYFIHDFTSGEYLVVVCYCARLFILVFAISTRVMEIWFGLNHGKIGTGSLDWCARYEENWYLSHFDGAKYGEDVESISAWMLGLQLLSSWWCWENWTEKHSDESSISIDWQMNGSMVGGIFCWKNKVHLDDKDHFTDGAMGNCKLMHIWIQMDVQQNLDKGLQKHFVNIKCDVSLSKFHFFL